MATKLVFHIQGFQDIRLSPGMALDIQKRVDRIQQACGEGYEAVVEDMAGSSSFGPRVRGAVYTYSYDAIRDNAKHNTLLAALDSGR